MKNSVNMKNLFIISLAVLLCAGCKGKNGGSGTDPVTPTVNDVMTYITTADNTMHFDKVGKNIIEGLNMNPEIDRKSVV